MWAAALSIAMGEKGGMFSPSAKEAVMSGSVMSSNGLSAHTEAILTEHKKCIW